MRENYLLMFSLFIERYYVNEGFAEYQHDIGKIITKAEQGLIWLTRLILTNK